MAQATPTRRPPEERFWLKYSPHYELPISSASSFVVHALGLTLLILGGVFATRLGLSRDSAPPQVSAIRVGPGPGSGGNAQGNADAAANGIVPKGNEAVPEPNEQFPKAVEPEDRPRELKEVKVQPPPLFPGERKEDARAVEEVRRRVQDQLDGVLAPRGKGPR